MADHEKAQRLIKIAKTKFKEENPDYRPPVLFYRDGTEDKAYCYGFDAMIVSGLLEIAPDQIEPVFMTSIHIGIINIMAPEIVASNRSVQFIGNYPELAPAIRIENGVTVEATRSISA